MTAVASRRSLIRRILAEEEVGSQEELLDSLEARGVRTTQPALSRDLRALRAAKQDGRYVLRAEDEVTPLERLASLLRGAEPAGPHLVVVRTEPGAANAVARALETEGDAGLVGSVAGDDTILIAARSQAASRRILRRLRQLA